MKKLVGFLCAVTLVFAASESAYALQLLTNGDFEKGDFTGWDHSGNVQIIDFDDGTLLGAIADFVADAQGMDNYFALFGAGSTSEEASLSQEFTLSNISKVTISFNWAFDYYDLSDQNDTFVSLVTLQGASVINVTLLDLTSLNPGGITSGYFEQTYDLTPYGLAGADIGFTLTEADTWLTGSLAGIDNVSVTASTPVPEPATILLMGTGLLGIIGFGRKRLNKKA